MDVSAGAWEARGIRATEARVPGGSKPSDMIVGSQLILSKGNKQM